MDENIIKHKAKELALAEIKTNPDEVYDEFQFAGAAIGLPNDEYVLIKYFRRKAKPLDNAPYDYAGVTAFQLVCE